MGSFVLLPLVDIVHCCLSRETDDDCSGAVCGEEVVGGDGDGEIGTKVEIKIMSNKPKKPHNAN